MRYSSKASIFALVVCTLLTNALIALPTIATKVPALRLPVAVAANR
jgi:hypothetical protein